jgi:hypothetical protein
MWETFSVVYESKDRIEWKKGGHNSDTCTLTIIGFLCSPYMYKFSCPTLWMKFHILLMEMSPESPGFIKCWPRYLNLNVAKASQSQRKCGAVSDACMHLSDPGLSTIPSLSRCTYKWQHPVSSTFIIHNWFLLKFSNSPVLLTEVPRFATT